MKKTRGPGQSRTADQRFRKCWARASSQLAQPVTARISCAQLGRIIPIGSYLSTYLSTESETHTPAGAHPRSPSPWIPSTYRPDGRPEFSLPASLVQWRCFTNITRQVNSAFHTLPCRSRPYPLCRDVAFPADRSSAGCLNRLYSHSGCRPSPSQVQLLDRNGRNVTGRSHAVLTCRQ